MNKHEKIFGKGWYELLNPFLVSDDFKKIRARLKRDMDAGITIYPTMDIVFRAFSECLLEKLTTVILCTNPYIKGECDGLALSSGYAQSIYDTPPALEKVFDAVEEDVANGLYLDRRCNLKRWANQGILLLNCDLTTEAGKPGSHLELWKPFIEYLITILSTFKVCLYCLIGKEAQNYIERIDYTQNSFYVLEHPQIAVIKKRPWNHNNIFSKLSNAIKFINEKEIKWT